jgi:hypothetical protein
MEVAEWRRSRQPLRRNQGSKYLSERIHRRQTPVEMQPKKSKRSFCRVSSSRKPLEILMSPQPFLAQPFLVTVHRATCLGKGFHGWHWRIPVDLLARLPRAINFSQEALLLFVGLLKIVMGRVIARQRSQGGGESRSVENCTELCCELGEFGNGPDGHFQQKVSPGFV